MSSRKKSTKTAGVTPKAQLADRTGPLKREEVQCPICWSILIEPVTPPCSHALCCACFKKHVAETSLQCPCCRMRLSVWSRKVFRENNLVDKKLWDRIQKEFPRLVQTRLVGEDSQNLLPEDLVSVFETAPVSGEKFDEFLVPIARPIKRDGEISTGKGEIKKELEEILRTHQEDIENKKRVEEEQSQELIKQLQEHPITPKKSDEGNIAEDFQFAQKIFQEEKSALSAGINARRKLFAELPDYLPKCFEMHGSLRVNKPDSPSCRKSAVKLHSTPNSGKKRLSASTNSSAAKKQKALRISYPDTRRPLHCVSQSSSDSGGNSQMSILNYLSPINSQPFFGGLSPPLSLHSTSPHASTSTYCNKLKSNQTEWNTSKNSAFVSPSSASPQENWKSPCIRKSKIETITKLMEEEETEDRDIPTPNSIDLETNCHFRPIATAPKTPPKKRSDGSFLPEPTLIKSTAIKTISIPTPCKPCNSNVPITVEPEHKLRPSSPESDYVIARLPYSLAEAETMIIPNDDVIISSSAISKQPTVPCLENSDNYDAICDENIFNLFDKNSGPLPESLELDLGRMEEQANALEMYRLKVLQEDQDRKLAKKLQKELNGDIVRDFNVNPYGLRHWLKGMDSNSSSVSTRKRKTRSSTINPNIVGEGN